MNSSHSEGGSIMKDISFKYIFNDDYNPQYVNGAFGGTGSQGEIVIHFYAERGAVPKRVDHTINDTGELGAPIKVYPDDCNQTFVRYIQSGIILDKKHATDIYHFLGKILGEQNEK